VVPQKDLEDFVRFQGIIRPHMSNQREWDHLSPAGDLADGDDIAVRHRAEGLRIVDETREAGPLAIDETQDLEIRRLRLKSRDQKGRDVFSRIGSRLGEVVEEVDRTIAPLLLLVAKQGGKFIGDQNAFFGAAPQPVDLDQGLPVSEPIKQKHLEGLEHLLVEESPLASETHIDSARLDIGPDDVGQSLGRHTGGSNREAISETEETHRGEVILVIRCEGRYQTFAESRQPQSGRRKGDAEFADSGIELDRSAAGTRLGLEAPAKYLSGDIGDKPVLDGFRLARCQGLDGSDEVIAEIELVRARNMLPVDRDRDQVLGRLREVCHRHEQGIRRAFPNHVGMAEGQVEPSVNHFHRGLRAGSDGNGLPPRSKNLSRGVHAKDVCTGRKALDGPGRSSSFGWGDYMAAGLGQ